MLIYPEIQFNSFVCLFVCLVIQESKPAMPIMMILFLVSSGVKRFEFEFFFRHPFCKDVLEDYGKTLIRFDKINPNEANVILLCPLNVCTIVFVSLSVFCVQ